MTYKQKYFADGYVSPIRVMSADEALELRNELEKIEKKFGGHLPPELHQKMHLVFPWVADLIRNPNILHAVQEILGPNILCWTTNLFAKDAHSKQFVSWHQDAPYWGLEPHDVLTAWIALSPSHLENGCLKVVPGSHKKELSPHRDSFNKNNLLTRGQEIQVEVSKQDAHPIELQPGEMSLHHVRIVHGSGPNTSNDRRIGIAIRYLPTHVKQIGLKDTATLACGVDQFKNFDVEKAPDANLSWSALREHNRAANRQIANNFKAKSDSPLSHRIRLALMRVLFPIVMKFRLLLNFWRGRSTTN